MPVNTKCPSFQLMESDYKMLDTIRKGERAIKQAGEEYLPRLSKQTPDEYNAYKNRGSFYNALKKTIQAMTGALLRKNPVIEVPDSMKQMLKTITVDNKSIEELIKIVCDNVLENARIGLLVDKDSNESDPYVAVYRALNIINWRTEMIGGKEQLSLLVLREAIEKEDLADEFEVETFWQYRVFHLIYTDMDRESGEIIQLDEPYVEITVYREDDRGQFSQYGEISYPEILGRRISSIPFFFIGATDNSPDPDEPPLLDLANLNIAHWKFSVDLAHGLHFTALPTPVVIGVTDQMEFHIGGTKAWSLPEGGDAKFLEFTGAGLESIDKHLDKLETRMATLGAQLLQDRRTGVEAAETARIRQTAEISSLITIAKTISSGMTDVLDMVYKWMALTETIPEDISVTVNTDFIETKLTPQEIIALLQALQAGKISLDTFLYQLIQGEILPPDRNVEDEKRLIEAEQEEAFEKQQGALDAAAERVARYQNGIQDDENQGE